MSSNPDASSPTDGPSLSSELLEPLLGDAFSLCLRKLIRSPRRVEDFEAFRQQVRGIDRVAIVNVAWGNRATGAHANVAAGNLVARVERFLSWPLFIRNDVLDHLEGMT